MILSKSTSREWKTKRRGDAEPRKGSQGEAWVILERAFEAQERVDGTIFGRVKGGFTVDLAGATAFLPGSQVDIRPVKDIATYWEFLSHF